MAVELTVVGSINLDFVARMERLPAPGRDRARRTQFERYPGGKGANQAVAAARMGAKVRMIGAVGDDALADEALAGLVEAGVELERRAHGADGRRADLRRPAGRERDRGVPGRERAVTPREVEGAVLCQLEVADEVVLRGRGEGRRSSPSNAAPARVLDLEPDLLVVNRFEHEVGEARQARRRHLRRRRRGAVRGRQAGRRLGVAADRPGRRHRRRRRLHGLPRRRPARGAPVRGGAAARVHGRRVRRGDARRPERRSRSRPTRGLAEEAR